MAVIAYYLLLPFIYLLSILPFWVLHIISDALFILFYYILGYRKKIIFQNLRNSFPGKTEHEIKQLTKKYYHHLCDLFFETFKTLTISRKAMLKRCTLDDASIHLLDKLAAENRSCILMTGHQGNWEWIGNTLSISCKQQLYIVYHPLSNKEFNGLMYGIRSRFGAKLIAMKDTARQMLANSRELTATAFAADQSPQPDNAYWTSFLNQDTPFFKGAEVIARKTGDAIVYMHLTKTKRSHYHLSLEMLIEHPKATAEGEITETYIRHLERDIIAQPYTWLWSHRRWKHKR